MVKRACGEGGEEEEEEEDFSLEKEIDNRKAVEPLKLACLCQEQAKGHDSTAGGQQRPRQTIAL
jgi:hypothetical protein